MHSIILADQNNKGHDGNAFVALDYSVQVYCAGFAV